jgi:hypothetical protein
MYSTRSKILIFSKIKGTNNVLGNPSLSDEIGSYLMSSWIGTNCFNNDMGHPYQSNQIRIEVVQHSFKIGPLLKL